MLGLVASAQVQFEASIDSMALFVGQQARITLDVTADAGTRVIFPAIHDGNMLVGDVEVVEVSSVDTTSLDNGRRRQCTRVVTVTSFSDHDTLYQIPPFSVMVDDEEVSSNALALKVFTLTPVAGKGDQFDYRYEVDTLHVEQFFPVNDIVTPELTWYEMRLTVYLGIVAFLLLVLGIVTLIFLRKGRPLFTIRTRLKKHIPPHVRAMDEMDRIRINRSAVESGSKEYYTQLTDVLRTYISERFHFNAMEMTSSEIIESLLSHDSSMVNELRELFSTADMVKFAKASTEISENDRNLVNAIAYIEETKADELPTETVEKTELTRQQTSYNRQRRLMVGIACGCGALVLIYLGFMVWKMVDWWA